MKAMNDEGTRIEKITLEEEGQLLTGKAAVNTFARAYAAASDTNIPQHPKKEVRTEEMERKDGTQPIPDSMKVDISMAELKEAIQKLKKKKSPGPDNITNEILQHLGNSALQTLLDIFYISWKEGQVPQCWKEATMIPILKRGKNKSKAPSYRPSSLTSCVCKTMERIVNQRLQL